jgi:hypothetical protein
LPWPVSSGPGFTVKFITSFTKTFVTKKSRVNLAVKLAAYLQLRSYVNFAVKLG